LIEFMP